MFDLGVLTKNYADNIQSGIAKAASGPVTFRSAVHWRSASEALDAGKHVVVYIVTDGGSGRVTHQATLTEVKLDPELGASDTKRLLARAPDATASEGLWRDTVRTLFSVTELQALADPFTNPNCQSTRMVSR